MTGFSHPPVIMNSSPVSFPAPPHNFRIQGLSHAQDVPEGGEIVLLRRLLADCHQHPECRWSAIPDVHSEMFDRAVPLRGVKAAATDQVGRSIQPGRENPV